MKIALISFHSFLKPGGVKRHVFGLYEEFKKRGIQVKIIVPRRKRSENYGKNVILLGTSFPFPFTGSQADLCINFNPVAIQRVLKKEKFDILHFHNFGFPSAFQILERSNALNILTFHSNIEGSNFFKMLPGTFYLFNKMIQWKINGIIGVAPLCLKFFKDFKRPKIVIPNGVDLEGFNPNVSKIKRFLDDKVNRAHKDLCAPVNILFVGRIEKRKGLIYLLKAYKILTRKFSNLRLIIVGKGDLKEECQQYVKENKLKEVYFEREVTDKELPSYYASCDIFCSPAIFGESFGIVLLEAMACGAPVVAFANQGYKEFLQGKKGERLLTKPRDYRGLAKKIEILIKNPQLRKEMEEWGYKEAQNYSWPKIADQVLDFYRFCAENKKKI